MRQQYWKVCCQDYSEKNYEFKILSTHLVTLFKVKSDEFFENSSFVDMSEMKIALVKLMNIFSLESDKVYLNLSFLQLF